MNSREYQILQNLSVNIRASETYWYKNRPYKILQETAIKEGGEWVPVVIYICLYDNSDGKIWIRKTDEFDKKFSSTRPENPYYEPKVSSLK